MIIIHHLGISQSERVIWLCEEMTIPYDLRRYDRDSTGLAPPEYRALHPMGIAPIITDGGLVLAESGAIVDYINSKYGAGRLAVKPDEPGFPEYLFWFHFANGTLMPSQMGGFLPASSDGSENRIVSLLLERSNRAFALAESRLADASFFAGEKFTTADIMMLFPLTTMRAFIARDLADFPHLRLYLKRIGERPAYQRAMSKGDPGMQPLLN